MAHHQPSDREIRVGEPIVIDMGATAGGYCSDITRTVVVGEPDDTFRKIYDIVLGAQLTAIHTVKAGMTGADVLMILVGGESPIDGAKAAEIVPTLDARIVIPMHYKTPVSKGDLESADRFLKEMQATAVQAQPKLSLSYNTVPSDTQVILLDYRGKNG